MFGYHDEPNCAFDLWAPNPTTWGYNAVENRAFSAYAFHQTEMDKVIEEIGAGNLSPMISFDLTADDVAYIENEVYKRYGLVCHIN